MNKGNLITAGLLLAAGYVVVKMIKGGLFNPFSDKNLAYEGADALVKAALGPKATVTDLIPGINKTNATTTAASSKLRALSVAPTSAAPYWYNEDGSKRMTPMTKGGTVYGAYGQRLQITDTAAQLAAYVSELKNL